MADREKIHERYEFRDVRVEETEETVIIEQTCFPPNEACPPESMRERVKAAPGEFLVAIDKEKGTMAGFLNGIATKEEKFRDAFFTDAGLQDPDGTNVMLLGLDVMPSYRRQGLAAELVNTYCERARERGRERLVLTCLEHLVKMYEGMGFTDLGMADSTWGGEAWHEMEYRL